VDTENVRNDKTFIPEKYGMILCPHCRGSGKIYSNGAEFQVCSVCGGFGAIRKPKEEVNHFFGVLESSKKGKPGG
jgi:DnaJ-class molecular chaperone